MEKGVGMTTSRCVHEIWAAEDDEGHYRLLLKILERSNIQASVRRFFDGQQVLDYLTQHETVGNPDNTGIGLLLELRLPKISGEEVLRRIRLAALPILRELPVVVVTSSRDPDDRIACLRLGCDAFLEKPFNPQQLDSAILLAMSRRTVQICASQRRGGCPILQGITTNLKSFVLH